MLAVLAVGPGLMSNTALSSVQGLVQKAVGTSVFTLVNPILIGNMAFALLVPAGPLLRKNSVRVPSIWLHYLSLY